MSPFVDDAGPLTLPDPVPYPCAFTHAVVATFVELSAVAAVVAVLPLGSASAFASVNPLDVFVVPSGNVTVTVNVCDDSGAAAVISPALEAPEDAATDRVLPNTLATVAGAVSAASSPTLTPYVPAPAFRSEEHTSELQSHVG